MIAVDTNILVYSHRPESPFHGQAKTLLDDLRMGPDLWAIPWPSIHEFLGVVTNPKIFLTATPMDVAIRTVEGWQSGGNLQLIAEAESHWPILTEILMNGKVRGAKVHDARIAALCLAHGVPVLLTADRDFSAFPKLKTRNPLKSG